MIKDLTVVIITYNEETRIRDCIDNVRDLAEHVIVVDDESTDKTRDIAEELGAGVYVRKMDIEGRHRNWAYSQVKTKWILSIDADERLTDGLKKEIRERLRDSQYQAYDIPRRNMVGDYWLRWGGQYPSDQTRLFVKGVLTFEEKHDVHPASIINVERPCLDSDIIHYTYRDVADMFRKMNNQTTLEAVKWNRIRKEDPEKAAQKMNFLHALWRSMDRFCRAYFRKKGYKDGFYGFVNAYVGSVYQMAAYLKYYHLIRTENGG